jgi:hypothetical protein
VESVLRYWLAWPSVEHFIGARAWVWPLCETFHFFGIVLLIGGVGLFDLRILGMRKDCQLRPSGGSCPGESSGSLFVSSPA